MGDGSGNMPAIAAGAMTGVESATKSASDPATDTNPATGLGTKWINTTSGEIYICTDATADENVWTSTGGTSGNIAPFIYQGTQYGYTSGGYNNAIEKHSYTADGNASDVADLTMSRSYIAGHSSGTHGYTSGGGGAPNTYIEKFSFAAGTDSVSTGFYLSTGTATRNGAGQTSTQFHAYTMSGTSSNIIDRFSYTTDGTATDVGDTTTGSGYGQAGASSETHGYGAGGEFGPSWATVNTIDKFAFGSSANATDVGDLTTVSHGATGHQSETHGYKAGGNYNSYTTGVDSIQKWTFASDADATNVGTTTVGRFQHASGSSTTHGHASGGATSGNGNVIEKFTFASDAGATDVGDLVTSKSYACGQQY